MEKGMKFGTLYKYKAHCVPWFLKVNVVIETGDRADVFYLAFN